LNYCKLGNYWAIPFNMCAPTIEVSGYPMGEEGFKKNGKNYVFY
jgi:hypothetical protein